MTLVPFQRDEGFFYFQKFSVQKSFKEEIKWQRKKFVESITDMEVDFPQWYTDVVKKRT